MDSKSKGDEIATEDALCESELCFVAAVSKIIIKGK